MFSTKIRSNVSEFWIQIEKKPIPTKTVAKVYADSLEEVYLIMDPICEDFVTTHNIGGKVLYRILEVPKMFLNSYEWSDN